MSEQDPGPGETGPTETRPTEPGPAGTGPAAADADGSPERSTRTWVLVGAGLIVVGALWLLDAVGALALRWQLVLPAALTVVGVALLVTARREASGGLVGIGIVLGVLTLLTGPPPGGIAGVGEREERPTGAVTAEADYDLGIGSLRVDLTEAQGLDDTTAIPVSVGIGDAVVVLPEGVGARIEASAGIGEVRVLGRSRGGLGVSVEEELEGDPVIDLEVSAGIGRVEVTR